MQGIKIFCPHCKGHILETTDKFKVGGPYDCTMFTAANDRRTRLFFENTRHKHLGEHLSCPRCDRFFIDQKTGTLLTAHGLVRRWQFTIDPSVSIVHEDGPHKGILRPPLVDSRELPKKGVVGKRSPFIGGSVWTPMPKTTAGAKPRRKEPAAPAKRKPGRPKKSSKGKRE
jgi:hypothetical protein